MLFSLVGKPKNHNHKDHDHGHSHGHSHSHHGHDHAHHHAMVGNIRTAILLNFSFTIVELIGGLLTNSMAVLSDALHDLGDTIILTFAYYSEKYSGKKLEDTSFTYGLSRLPLVSAFLSSFILFAGSVGIIAAAIPRLYDPVEPNATGMLYLSIPGILINLAALMKIKKNEGVNTRVLVLHFLEDALGWVAVLIISIIMHFVYLPILDPLLSIAITLYILIRVAGNLKNSAFLFIQKAPEEVNLESIKNEIKNLKKTNEICDLHLWSLDSIHHIFTIHVGVSQKISRIETIKLKADIRKILSRHGKFHATIEVEYEDEECKDTC